MATLFRSPFRRLTDLALSGVEQPCTSPLDAWDFAILPREISAQRCHVRCNGLLASPRRGFGLQFSE